MKRGEWGAEDVDWRPTCELVNGGSGGMESARTDGWEGCKSGPLVGEPSLLLGREASGELRPGVKCEGAWGTGGPGEESQAAADDCHGISRPEKGGSDAPR